MTGDREDLKQALESGDPQTVLVAVAKELPALRSEVRLAGFSWRVVALAMVLAIVIGGVTIRNQSVSSGRISDAVAAQATDRAAARLGSCKQDNIRIQQHNDLVAATDASLSAAEAIQVQIDSILAQSVAPNPSDTPDQAARRAQFAQLVAQLKAQVDSSVGSARASLVGTVVAARDCSPEGIEKYLSDNP